MPKIFRPNSEAQENFINCTTRFSAYIGGVGCVDGNTLIGEGVSLGDAANALVGVYTLLGTAQAEAPFVKGQADLYRLRTTSGREIVATANHYFLTPLGWRPLSHLPVGHPICGGERAGDLDIDLVDEVRWDHFGTYYDVTVPGPAHYLSNGLWSHNSGKTASGAIKAISKINDGEDGIVVGPDFPHFTKSTWPEFAKWVPWSHCTNKHLEHPYTQQKVLKFDVRGMEVKVWYGGIDDPTSWTGPNVNWCWFDEGARKDTRTAFDVLAARCRIGKRPQLWITTTPRGVNHWLYDIFIKGIFPQPILEALREAGYVGKVTECFHGKTSDNQENLDPFTFLTLTGIYSGKTAAQELDGAFVNLEGSVWDTWKSSNVSVEAEYKRGVPVEWWVDDGFTEGHPRVILMAQVIPPYINVFDECISWYQLAEDSVDEALKKPYEKANVAYCDSSAAELRSRLWRRDIDTVKATHDVMEGVKHATSFIGRKDGTGYLRFHPRCEFSVKEMQAYTYDERTGRPKKQNDNVSDAVRYGLWSKDLQDIIRLGEKYRPAVDVDRRGVDSDEDEIILHPNRPQPAPVVGSPQSYKWYLEQMMQRSRVRVPGQTVRLGRN